MSTDPTLTATRLRELLDYNPDTGQFRWRVKLSNRVHVGDVAGNLQRNGYRTIRINTVLYGSHQLAWVHVHGWWPAHDIDHMNGIPSDNRLANLREATRGQNLQNRHGPDRDTRSGFLGVTPRRKRWIAQIGLEGRNHYLGIFDTPEEASDAYLAAKKELHPFWVEPN